MFAFRFLQCETAFTADSFCTGKCILDAFLPFYSIFARLAYTVRVLGSWNAAWLTSGDASRRSVC